jgi:hypothetical protein
VIYREVGRRLVRGEEGEKALLDLVAAIVEGVSRCRGFRARVLDTMISFEIL